MTQLADSLDGAAATGLRRTLHSSPYAVWVTRIAVFIVFLGAWEWYGSRLSRALFAPFSDVLSSFRQLTILEPTIPQAIMETNVSLAFGFGLSGVVGTIVGLAMGRWEFLGRLLGPYVSFLYTLPRIALIPLFILWFGLGAELRVAIVVFGAVFPVIINAEAGVRQISDDLRDVASVARASAMQEMRTVIFPGSLPYVMVGLRNGLAQAFVGVIIAEMTAVLTGLGGLVRIYANFFQVANMFVPIVIIAAESVLIFAGMKLIHRRLAPWST